MDTMIGILAWVVLIGTTSPRAMPPTLTQRDVWVPGEALPTCVSFVTLDPSDPRTLFASSGQPSDLHRSVDGGKTWVSLAGPPAYISSITVSPTQSSTVFAVAQGFYVSRDGGETWEQSTSAPSYLSGGLVVDPFSPETLYAHGNCCYGGPYSAEVWFSSDEGAHWIRKDDGLPEGNEFVHITSLLQDPRIQGRLLASLSTGVYLTVDQGNHWSRISLSNVGLLWGFDAASSDIVWASNAPVSGTFQAAARSVDGGTTWASVDVLYLPGIENAEVADVTISALIPDPVVPGTAYATANTEFSYFFFTHQVLRTTDGGGTWDFFGSGIPDIDASNVRDIVIDAAGRTLRASTCGALNTVYRLDLRRPRLLPAR